ncbi:MULTISPECIES: hypothetical protein [Caproicibacterium]|uniref:Uncharacterized protein n=1 Tax=Caproicibacterium lactatifermentans TaxID=2666138 RepID=A0A859DPF1_9FIRM|nr:hypothetical protein [Caproicibacterium lactatifermentans]ARP50605.1 hypothetical protein B6259_06765 [Ruminococcaceae bacterium CPB6]MDD4808257.1 hypothetical protein [Oscillospiraceae bacterium]QKN23660.1 hypothetical protein GJQ69_03705 [Caproicibacterium lactatifermentans]QKO29667.1 hypothetical protein GKP14_00665 [Caproicibacterium lactatifermentans]
MTENKPDFFYHDCRSAVSPPRIPTDGSDFPPLPTNTPDIPYQTDKPTEDGEDSSAQRRCRPPRFYP